MTGLPTQTAQIIFSQGVDTKTNPRVLPAGKLVRLENAVFTKIGRIEKRTGFDPLKKEISGSESEIIDSKALLTFQDEMLQVANSKLYSYSESAQAWLDRGFISSVSVNSKTVIRNTGSQSHPDVAISQNVALFAWEDSRGGVRATAIDLSTGLTVISDVQVSSTGSRPKVSATNSYLYVHFMDTSNGFKVRRLNPLEPATGFEAATTLASDANGTNPNFDIFRLGSNLLFCYNTAGDEVVAGYLTDTGDIGTSLTGKPDPVTISTSGASSVAIVGRFEGDADDAIYVFIHNTTDGLVCSIYDTTLLSASVVTVDAITTQVNQIAAIVQDNKARVFYEVDDSDTFNRFVKCDAVDVAGTVDSSGTSTGTGNVFLRSVGLASKPFQDSDANVHVVCVHESQFQPTYFTVRRISDTRGFIANTVAKDEAGGLHAKRASLSNVPSISSTKFLFPSRIKTRLVSENDTVFGIVGLQRTELDFDDSGLFVFQDFAKNLHIAGGVLQNYDGTSVTEHGFFLFPENIENAITTSMGSIEAGTRQYSVVYEWTDNQGNRHQSAPSIPIDVTNALNDKNTLTIPTLRLTEKKAVASRSEVSIAIYRTTADGEIFYRLGSVTSPTANDTTVDSVTYEDTVADTTIEDNEILYITGGVVDNTQPKSSKIVAEYNDRLFLGDEDEGLCQFSKKRVAYQGMAFNDGFKFRADQGGGAISAVARLDDKLVLFKKSKLLIQAGQGPLPTGVENDFQTPQALPPNVGTEIPRSVIEYDGGLIFKSDKGWYELDRGLNVSYIGAPVEAYNNLTVSGSVHISSRNTVIFLHSDGPALAYDYLVGQWDVFTAHECLSAVEWQGDLCLLKSDNTVWRASAETFLDAGSTQDLLIQTPWISFGGLNGFQRVKKILINCERKSSHKVLIKIAYDDDEAPKEYFVFDPDSALGTSYYGDGEYYGAVAYYGGANGKYDIEIKPKIQKCKNFQLTIQDVNPDGVDGQGVILTGFGLEYGVKRGLYRVGNAKRAVPQ